MSRTRTIRYEAEDGMVIKLVVPWSSGTGQIPPPAITFLDAEGRKRPFYYRGAS